MKTLGLMRQPRTTAQRRDRFRCPSCAHESLFNRLEKLVFCSIVCGSRYSAVYSSAPFCILNFVLENGAESVDRWQLEEQWNSFID